MSRKSPPLAFQPAPRPRLSDANAALLSEVTADLGFARPVSVPEPPPDVAPTPRRAARAAGPPTLAKAPLKVDASAEDSATASLKIEVPDRAWVSLKLEAVRRRVTVRFLILEALARQGYDIDLAHIPQDGRRLR